MHTLGPRHAVTHHGTAHYWLYYCTLGRGARPHRVRVQRRRPSRTPHTAPFPPVAPKHANQADVRRSAVSSEHINWNKIERMPRRGCVGSTGAEVRHKYISSLYNEKKYIFATGAGSDTPLVFYVPTLAHEVRSV